MIAEDQRLTYNTLTAKNEYTDQGKTRVKTRLTFPLDQVTGILLTLFKF